MGNHGPPQLAPRRCGQWESPQGLGDTSGGAWWPPGGVGHLHVLLVATRRWWTTSIWWPPGGGGSRPSPSGGHHEMVSHLQVLLVADRRQWAASIFVWWPLDDGGHQEMLRLPGDGDPPPCCCGSQQKMAGHLYFVLVATRRRQPQGDDPPLRPARGHGGWFPPFFPSHFPRFWVILGVSSPDLPSTVTCRAGLGGDSTQVPPASSSTRQLNLPPKAGGTWGT